MLDPSSTWACALCCCYIFVVFVLFFVLFLFSCSRWSFVDVPLVFSSPTDHVVPDWQPRILLGIVEARSVNVKNTTTISSVSTIGGGGGYDDSVPGEATETNPSGDRPT